MAGVAEDQPRIVSALLCAGFPTCPDLLAIPYRSSYIGAAHMA
jgi:hypothetical protein